MIESFSAIAASREQAHEAATRAYEHAQAMIERGEPALISCGPAVEPVSIRQRRFLHGVVLRQISEQAQLHGVRFTVDIWKEHFRQRFVGDGGFRWESMRVPRWDPDLGQLILPKHATPRRVRISSEELGQREYARWTNEIIDHAVVELGVEFHFTTEERELIARRPQPKEERADVG